MRFFIAGTFCLFSLLTSAQSFFDQVDDFMSKYVNNGAVDYEAIVEHPKELKALVAHIAELNLSNKRVTPNYLKAFYINSYNLLVIQQVVDRYPIEGPLKIDGFFDGIKHNVMGEEMTLDQLEKGTLNKQFPDPRLHFVLVCAAKGCPPLARFGYTPDDLDNQLTNRTSEVLNLDSFIRVTKEKTKVSQIFNWYRSDFEQSGESIESYINSYRKDKIDFKNELWFYEYDWSLNEQ